MDKKLFSIDDETRLILEQICDQEGIAASEFLRLCVRAWRAAVVFVPEFKHLTSWQKTKATIGIVKKELQEIKTPRQSHD